VANDSAAASVAATIHLQLPYRTKVNLTGDPNPSVVCVSIIGALRRDL
jgi:hypothetical protein